MNLQSFIAGAERGARSGLLPPGYFAKQTYLNVADTFNATYGRKVWDALNNQTRFWNILRKVQWGPTVGWRLRTDRGGLRSMPVLEGANLPGLDKSNYVGVSSDPRTVASPFGVSLKNQIMSGLEGGIGDSLAVEQEAVARDHIKELNRELLLRNYAFVSDATSTTSNITTDALNAFRIGDEVQVGAKSSTANTASPVRITGLSGTNYNTVATAALGTATADNDVLYAHSRAGFTSIDDIVHRDGINVAGTGSPANVDVYDVRTASGRSTNSWFAGNVIVNAGAGAALTLDTLNQAIRMSRIAGGDPDVILMGYDQYDRLQSLLQVWQRYLGREEFVVKMGDDSTLPGSHAGFDVATYRGIPVFVDPDVPTSLSATGAALGSNIYVLDTRYLELAIAAPTQYIDNRDFFQAQQFVLRGLFYTIGELRSLRFDVHTKIINLSA